MSEEKKMASIFDLVRMCKSFIKSGCKGCPLDGRGGVPCPEFDFTEKDNDLILAWCDEHPKKTYAQDFFEKFPRCEKDSDGTPPFCRDIVYGLNSCGDCVRECASCWNEVMPEEEKK